MAAYDSVSITGTGGPHAPSPGHRAARASPNSFRAWIDTLWDLPASAPEWPDDVVMPDKMHVVAIEMFGKCRRGRRHQLPQPDPAVQDSDFNRGSRNRTPRRHARCSSAARRRHAPRRRSWKPACPRRRGPPTSLWTPSTASASTGNPSCERTGRPQDALRVRLPARGHAPGWRNPEVPEDADPATVEEAPGRYHRERGSAGNGALTAGAERKHAPSGTRNRHAPGEACQTTADRRRAEHTS